MSAFFSVIIPSLNEEKNLEVLLSSLSKQTDMDFEVFISDCFSTDKTKEVTNQFKNKLPALTFNQKKFKNVSAARNFGATAASGEYLIFFDADVEPEDNFIKQIKEKILQFNLDALTVWNRPKTKNITGIIILTILNIALSLFQRIKPGANGPCIIIKKDLFEKLKGFDETIVFGEDFDLIQKAWRAGAKFAVFSKPRLFVSARRFEKEGFFLSVYKSLRALVHQLFTGPIRKHIFDYQMGGQYYQEEKPNKPTT